MKNEIVDITIIGGGPTGTFLFVLCWDEGNVGENYR